MNGLSPNVNMKAAEIYIDAKIKLIDLGFSEEIDWQHEVATGNVTEEVFSREYCWVVYSAGFSERVLRKHFAALTTAYRDFISVNEISRDRLACLRDALRVFNNQKKANGFISGICAIAEVGFMQFWKSFSDDPFMAARELPYIGNVTANHLLKNLGFGCAKADRHLVRMASRLGFESPEDLCLCVSRETGDPVDVVDLIWWRYSIVSKAVPPTEKRIGKGHAPSRNPR